MLLVACPFPFLDSQVSHTLVFFSHRCRGSGYMAQNVDAVRLCDRVARIYFPRVSPPSYETFSKPVFHVLYMGVVFPCSIRINTGHEDRISRTRHASLAHCCVGGMLRNSAKIKGTIGHCCRVCLCQAARSLVPLSDRRADWQRTT